jgi:hypothetical protein
MLQIRRGVFETNSSSTHSFTLLNGESFKFELDYRLKYGGETLEEILKIKTDENNNILLDVYPEKMLSSIFIGVNEKLIFLIAAIGKNYDFSLELKKWKIEQLDFFEEINDIAKRKGYNGIKILAEGEEFFNPNFILNNDIVGYDIDIVNIKQLEKDFEIDIDTIIFDNEIVLEGNADRNRVYDNLEYTIKRYKELRENENIK